MTLMVPSEVYGFVGYVELLPLRGLAVEAVCKLAHRLEVARLGRFDERFDDGR